MPGSTSVPAGTSSVSTFDPAAAAGLNTQNVAVSNVTSLQGVVLDRQQIVMADPFDVTHTLSLVSLRMDRQVNEMDRVSNAQNAMNVEARRDRERKYFMNIRGDNAGGRGASR